MVVITYFDMVLGIKESWVKIDKHVIIEALEIKNLIEMRCEIKYFEQ